MMLLIWQRRFESRLRRHCTPLYATVRPRTPQQPCCARSRAVARPATRSSIGSWPAELGQILPYTEGDRGSADAGDQADFFQDQNPPHVHIKGGDLIAGEAPNTVLKQARRWVEGHRAELLAMGNEFQR
jgi:uncharacterized protein DUF4160